MDLALRDLIDYDRPVPGPEEAHAATLAAYFAAISTAWKRGVFPFTAAYGREVEVSPETVHVEPWLEVVDRPAWPKPGSGGREHDLHPPSSAVDERRRDRTHPLVEKLGARGLVILGEPGAGKSTLMRWLACRALRDGRRLPILLSLPYLAALPGTTTEDLNLPDSAAEYWRDHGAPGLGPLFSAALAAGNALILLDGFDEAGDRRTRQQVATKITAEMARWRGQSNHWVFASRPHGYIDAPLPDPAVTRAAICPWDGHQIETAILGWCRALAHWQSTSSTPPDAAAVQTRSVRLRDQLRDDGPLQQLAQNPLSLAMLALLERMRDKLPDHRVRLYEAYADELIQRRPVPQTGDELEPSEFLIEIALWIHRKHPLGRVYAPELAKQCVRIALCYEGYLRPEEASPAILTLATRRARAFYRAGMVEIAGGILVESSPDFVSFSHRALQDFFVGRGLARMASERRWELLRPRLHAARWREPLLLCAGWLAAVERRREEIDLLCQHVFGAHSSDEPMLARDLRLAVAIAADSAGLVRHQRLAEFYRRMVHFSATFRSFAAFRMLLDVTAQLARLGLSEAQEAVEDRVEGGPQGFQRLALMALRGKLDGPNGQHLRDLAIKHLFSEDPQQRHVAWHALLPLWNLSENARDALLEAIDRDHIPRCNAVARELVRRALESSTEIMRRVFQHAWVLSYLPVTLSEDWPGTNDTREFILTQIRSDSPVGIQLAMQLAPRSDDQVLRPEFTRLLAHSDAALRLDLLKLLAYPRYGERITEYVQIALDDPDDKVRNYAHRVADELSLHLAGGEQRASELIHGHTEERRRVARNLRPEWWSVAELRPHLPGLFAVDDPGTATTAFSEGFAYLFAGQPELIDLALAALESEHFALRHAALTAMSAHLHAVPAFTDAVLGLLQRRAWPDLPQVIELLQRVVDQRGDVRTYLCEVLVAPDGAMDLRSAALACLAQVSHHDPRVWNAVKGVMEQAPTKVDMSLSSDAHGVLLRLGQFLPAESLRRGVVFLDNQRAGTLEESPTGTRFIYDDAWLSDPTAMAISLTMPLRALPYESEGLHPFFDNMLPEGWLLERVSGAEKIDKRDRLGILLATGSDTIGAVSVVPDHIEDEDA